MEYAASVELEQKIVKWILFSWLASLVPVGIYCLAYLIPFPSAHGPAKSLDLDELLQRGDSFVIALTLLIVAAGDLFGSKQVKGPLADLVVPFIVMISLIVTSIAIFYVELCHRMHESIPSSQLIGFSALSFVGVLIIGTICVTISTE